MKVVIINISKTFNLHIQFSWMWQYLPGRCCGSMGWGCHYLEPFILRTPKARAVSGFSAVSQTLFHVTYLVCVFSWTGFRAVVIEGDRAGYSLVGYGLHRCFLQMMWSCWHHRSLTFSTHWTGLQPSLKRTGWGSAPLNLRPLLAGTDGLSTLSREWVLTPSKGVQVSQGLVCK